MKTCLRLAVVKPCATALLLAAAMLEGCGPAATATMMAPPSPSPTSGFRAPVTPTAAPPATALPTPTAVAALTAYEFPTSISLTHRYMFYLHGKIIEDQGLAAVSPEFGAYEYASILKTLADKGFTVISEQRPKDADVWAYGREVGGQVAVLINAGVPPGHITVVGASKGAWIAAVVSFLLKNPGVNYVLLGSCHSNMVDEFKNSGMSLHGNVLTIRDAADVEYSGSCSPLFQASEGRGLGQHREIVLNTGMGHGIVYKPLDEWVLPTVEWASR